MATDPILLTHRDWINTLQPVGLVVSPPALLAAQAIPDQNILAQQRALIALMTPPAPEGARARSAPTSLPVRLEDLVTQVFGWKPARLVRGEALPEALSVVLPEFDETLRPSSAVAALAEDEGSWMMLLQEVAAGVDLDALPAEASRHWRASPQVRFERLLHDTGVPIGVLSNGVALRLVYAPRGESSGHITWPLSSLGSVMNRPLLSALCLLLGSPRLFALPRAQRLPTILRESRKYQNLVSTKLAAQVLEALNELLRGFQSANEMARGALLDASVAADGNHVYGGLLAVLLRLVFVLYAEERGMLSSSSVYVRNYALVGLFESLRADAGRYPDTMDQRYGAWSRLLVLFRMVHDGARRGDLRLPPRYGHLFDPDGWAFLEGRPYGALRVMGAALDVPRVSDGVVLRVLEKLLILDGDRLSYRALDVEQIGSVYENMMGFRLERAKEVSLGVGADHVVIGLETLLSKKGGERAKQLKAAAKVELTGRAAEALAAAKTVDDLVAALGRRASPLTPRPVAAGGLYLQPTDERRNSGSHYTPRELTGPIVRTTLKPILDQLGEDATPAAVLALKVCDPAMGSGAFLVEACRQLGARLVTAWDLHGRPADIAPDEDLQLYAQRLVTQHCLYGVDRNPFAVDLGKLSLWLATLARTHAFTFLDHAVRHGDSLVGLSREQIASFHWAPVAQVPVIRAVVDRAIEEALELRQAIRAMAGSDDVEEKRRLLKDADAALAKVRRVGDCVVACFFSEDKAKARETARRRWEATTLAWIAGDGSDAEIVGAVEGLRTGEKPVPCFHWEVEFPEVFGGGQGGFDAMVGNPPFAGKNTIAAGTRDGYIDWLKTVHPESHGASDLAAHFYRRAFLRLRPEGTFGLIASNTIYQGDTRATGLRWIRTHGGSLYSANRRQKWPGLANVVVSVVHGYRGAWSGPCVLNGREVERITAFLAPLGDDVDPVALKANEDRSFQGSIVLGMGFTFDDRAKDRDAVNSLAKRDELIAKDARNAERIFPYLGGSELTDDPEQKHHRYVINFGDMSEEEARAWPDLMAIVEEKVKPDRLLDNRPSYSKYWWQYAEKRGELSRALAGRHRALVISRHTHYASFGWLPTNVVFSEALVVFADDRDCFFSVMHSRTHEIWARFFSSSMKDDLRYSPSDCFVTFPFPPDWEDQPALDAAGRAYDAFRQELMLRTRLGLTDTYNRFHDPEESSAEIERLRELHDALDRAVLDAYGWTDLRPTCGFVADREPEEGDEEKVSWRYRWPETVHDEVFGRLLKLNAARAEAEAQPAAPVAGALAKKARKTKKASEPDGQGGLWD